MMRTAMRVLCLGLACLMPAVAAAQTEQVYYYHQDAVGSVRMITDANGQEVARYDYLPFGEEWNPPAFRDPRMFAGKERDTDTGFDYFGARYLSGGIGRFTTIDPVYTWQANLADPQRWNRYVYVRNNPFRFSDPDGRCLEDACVIEFTTAMMALHATAQTVAYLESPGGQEQLRATVTGLGQMVTTAVDRLSSLILTEKRPGTLGKPDHQATAAEEAARIGGEREVKIDTPAGKKGSRRADAVGVNPVTGAPEIVQVYRPTPAGNVPKREKDAAADIERATGVKPTMVPVRPAPKKRPEEDIF